MTTITVVAGIALSVLAIVASTRANALRRWDDESFDSGYLNVREDCTSNGCGSIYPEKRGVEFEQVGDKLRSPVSRVLTSSRATGRPWQVSCPCETQYDIIDLGLNNYPRHLATARCAAKACHNKFNQCRLVHYKVHILRQRETSIGYEASEEQQYVEQTLLPESLRVKWQMKPMKIAVACVAKDGKTN